ncbi:MAG: peptidoglycan-binding domain-containing protein [Patescibacteria group bacterium]
MRKNIIVYFSLIAVFAGFGLVLSIPGLAAAPFVTSDLMLKEGAVANSPAEFTVRLNNTQALPAGDLSLKIILPGASANLQSLELMTNSGWKTVTIIPQGQDLVAAFSLTDGLLFAGERDYPFRAVFRSAKDYLIGFTLESVRSDRVSVLSSAAQPLTVASGKVLGTTTYVFTKNLQYGSRGEEVTQLQLALTRAGVYSGPVTGYFGSLTRQAVRAYQTSKGITPVGTAGPLTRQALNGM